MEGREEGEGRVGWLVFLPRGNVIDFLSIFLCFLFLCTIKLRSEHQQILDSR